MPVTKTKHKTKYDSNAKKNETEVGKRTIDRITRGRTFEPFERSTIGTHFYIFKRRGDFIEGILGPLIQNYQRNGSYPITLDNDQIVEIFGNRLMHHIIAKNELLGCRVRIVYIGRQFTGRGHARKIYRFYKIEPTITNAVKEVN